MSYRYLRLGYILAIVLVINREKSQQYITNVGKYCVRVDFANWELTEDQRQAERDNRKSLIEIAFGAVYDFIQRGEPKSLVNATMVYIVVIGVLLVVCIVSFVLYSLYCCHFDQYKFPTMSKIKLLFALVSIFYLLFVILLILMIIYVRRLEKNYVEANCAISKTPNDIIAGVKFENKEFMGLRNLRRTLLNMESELSGLRELFDQFDAITTVSPRDLSQQAHNSLDRFNREIADVKIRDGNGDPNTPNSVINYIDSDKDAIITEFNELSDVSVAFYDAAEKGKTYFNRETVESTKAALVASAEVISEMIEPTEQSLDAGVSYMSKGSDYLAIAYYIALGLALIVLLVTAFMMVILYCQFANAKCFNMACLLKTGLVAVTMVNICLIAICLFAMALSSGISSFCDFSTAILTSSSIPETLKQSGASFTESEIKLYSTCLSKEPASVTKLIGEPSVDLTDISTLIDGFTRYRLYQPELTSDLNSRAIKAIVKIWEKYQTGLFIEFDNVNDRLAELNSNIRCRKIEFRINSFNCTDSDPKFECKSVSSVPSYEAPDCAEDKQKADRYFRNLLRYTNEKTLTIGDIIADLAGSDSSTPNTRFKTTKQALIDLKPNYSKIEFGMRRTMQLADQFGNGFSEGSDCSALRRTMENLEVALCFKLSNNLLFYFISLLAMVVCVILLNWLVCVTFRCIPQTKPTESQFDEEDTEDSGIVKDKGSKSKKT